MKIRFNMEIKGCQWKDRKAVCSCPYFRVGAFYGTLYCDAKIRKEGDFCFSKEIPKSLNPSWCPMMKKVAQ